MSVKIPKETLESMKRFFLKTSIPRIIAEERKQKEEQKDVS